MDQAKEALYPENSLLNSGDTTPVALNDTDLALQEDARLLAGQFFGGNTKKCNKFINHLLDVCHKAKDKEFLLIHNPGGWGGTPLAECLAWERSVVYGIAGTLERLGYSSLLTQHFRSENTWWGHMQDLVRQANSFFRGESSSVRTMATEMEFLMGHLTSLKIILIGISQGAAFSNAVMREVGEDPRIYSIELGFFFIHLPRRVITDRTLAIDSNGFMPDPMVQRNLRVGFKAYITAPWRWVKYRLQGNPQKFTYCINAAGHDYNWEYPAVRRRITEFLETKFGLKSKLEVGSS